MGESSVSKPAVEIEAAEQAQQVLERASKPVVDRFCEAITKLINGEVRELFDTIAAEFEGGGASAMSNELKVAFVADTCNSLYEPLLQALTLTTAKNPKLCRSVGEEAMGELKLVGRIATASRAKVECGVKWTAPAAMAETKEAARLMAAAQAEAVAHLSNPDTAAAAAGPLDELFAVVGRTQMPLYKARVAALVDDNGGHELYVTLPGVVSDLLPKFEKVRRTHLRCLPLSPPHLSPLTLSAAHPALLFCMRAVEPRIRGQRSSSPHRPLADLSCNRQRPCSQRGRLWRIQPARGQRVFRGQQERQAGAAGDDGSRRARAFCAGDATL